MFTLRDHKVILKCRSILYRGEGSSESASDSDASHSVQKKQRKVAVEYWDDVDREQVDKLPKGINGVRVFVIKNLDGKKTIEALKDGRRWKKKTVPRAGKARYADCRGSYLCENQKCPFRLDSE